MQKNQSPPPNKSGFNTLSTVAYPTIFVCLKRDKRCINRGKNEEKVNCFIQTAPNAFLPKILKKVPHYCRARVNPFHKTGKLFRYEEIN
jgi:hypothetical protein